MYYLSLPQLTPLFVWLLVFCILSYKKESWGVAAIIYLLPSYLVRFRIFTIPTTLLEIMIYLLFLIFIFKNYKKLPRFNAQLLTLFKKNKKLGLGIFLLLAGASLSTLLSTNTTTSLGILKGWFFDPLVFLIITSFIWLETREDNFSQKNILKPLALSGLAVGIFAFYYLIQVRLTFDGRLRAFYRSANHLGMYLAPCLLAYLGVFWPEKKEKAKIKFIKLGGFLLILIPFIATYSAGTWIGTGCAIFYLIFLNRKTILQKIKQKKPQKKFFESLALIFLGFIGLIIIFVAIIGSLPDYNIIIEHKIDSTRSRFVIWRSAFKILKDNWLWGIGGGMFQQYYLNYQKYFEPYPEWAVPQPHNIFLAFWLQTGIIGFSGFILILFWFFKSSFAYISVQIRKKSHIISPKSAAQNKKIAVIATAVMVYTLVHGLVDTPYWKNDLSIIFWMIVGVMLITESQIAKSAKTD